MALDGHTLKYGDFGIAQQQEPSDDEHNYSTQQTQSHYNQQQHSDDDDAFAALNSSRVSNEDSMRFAEEGDPRYLAPELLSGVYTRAADIFSLGMTLLELATGLDLPNHGSLWTRLRKPRPLDAIPPEFLTGTKWSNVAKIGRTYIFKHLLYCLHLLLSSASGTFVS